MHGFTCGLFCLLLQTSAFGLDRSDDSPASGKGGVQSEAGTTTGATSPAVAPAQSPALKGGVRGAALLTKDGLKKLSETSRALERSSLLMMGEFTRREMVAVRSPNMLPNGVVIQPVPSPTGTAFGGSLPARKRWVKIHLGEIGYNVQLLRNEIDALIVPDEKMSTVSVPWGQIRATMSLIEEHYRKLSDLCGGEKFDTKKIGRETVAIHDLSKHVNRLRSKVVDSLAKK